MYGCEGLPVELRTLAERGMKLFPVCARGKTPLIPQWQQRATSDADALSHWFTEHPRCNWGTATGYRSGVFVLDVDGPTGFEALSALINQHSALPITLSVLTARGTHLYFLVPDAQAVRTRTGFPASGIDVRGDGGYAVIPPSENVSGQRYKFENLSARIAEAPDWLVRAVAQRKTEFLPRIYKGHRNSRLARFAGSLRRKGATPEELENALLVANQARCVPLLDAGEVKRIAQSIARYAPGGPDVLARAWAAIEAQLYASTYERVLALFWQLQLMLPGQPVALPVVRIAEHLGCDWTLVRRYRQRAEADGFIRRVTSYVYKQKAAMFEIAAGPCTTSLSTTSLSTTSLSTTSLSTTIRSS